MLVYGTATLQQQHGNQILTVEELKELSRTAQARVVFNNGIPALSDALEKMRTQLYDFEREIDMNNVELKENRTVNKKTQALASKQPSQAELSEAIKDELPVKATEAPAAPQTSVQGPKSYFKPKLEDPRDTVYEKMRRRKVYGATKSTTVRKKPSSSWRSGDSLECPKKEDEGCCQDDEYNPYPKWWQHPDDKSSAFKKGRKPDRYTLDFALPCLSSYVHDPNVTEEDRVYPDDDDFNVYDYLHTKYHDSPVKPVKRKSPVSTDAEEEQGDQDEAEAPSITKLPRDDQGAEAQVQKSMGDFYNDHWMQYFVDRYSGGSEALERMEWSAAGSTHDIEDKAEGTSAAILSELSNPLASKLEFSSSDFNDESHSEDDKPKGKWKHLKGKESQYGGWVGEYDFTKKGRKPIKQWVKDNNTQPSRPKSSIARGGMKWDFDEILAL